MRVTGGVNSIGSRIKAAIDGRALHKWVDDKTIGTTDPTVLTDATLYYNLVENEMVLVTGVSYGINTVSDSGHFEIGYTDAAAGAGTFTAMMGHYEYSTGTVVSGRGTERDELMPPMVARYSAGARSITYRVTVNDTGAIASVSWCGFRVYAT